MKKNTLFVLMIGMLLTAWSYFGVSAQQAAELKLRLSRDFGYSSGSGSIQGVFTLKASGVENLAVVDFYLDGNLLLQDQEAPFEIKFNTDVYSLGKHTLSATGITGDGQELHAQEINVRFVTLEEGWQSVTHIMFPLLGIIFGLMLVTFVTPLVLSRGKLDQLPLGTPRKYGIFGGTICPKCFRPFSLHLYKMNLGFAKLDRCPYCGKWSLVYTASRDALRAAEAAEMKDAEGLLPEESEEDKLRKEIDASRYRSL